MVRFFTGTPKGDFRCACPQPLGTGVWVWLWITGAAPCRASEIDSCSILRQWGGCRDLSGGDLPARYSVERAIHLLRWGLPSRMSKDGRGIKQKSPASL